MCRGEYIGIINSDDVYTKDALKIIYKYIKNYLKKILFLAALKNTGVFYMDLNQKKSDTVGVFTQSLHWFFLLKTQQKNGPYNTKYRFHADYDYFYRMIVKNKMTGISTNKDEVTGIFVGGFSSTISFFHLIKEGQKSE